MIAYFIYVSRNVYLVLLYEVATAYRFLPQQELYSNFNPSNNIQHKYTPNILEVPYHVLIIYSNLFCSGSLIGSLTVLTAASCFWKYSDEKIMVKTGSSVISDSGNTYLVESIKFHEYYKHISDTDNDIALLLLKNHVVFGAGVKKVILVEPETVLRDNTPMRVSGWSTSERRLYDNGGPAVYQDLLVGIMSFVNTNPNKPYFALFTNISYFYRWIMLNTKYFLEKRCVDTRDTDLDMATYEYTN
ncbi:vitellin-degrading protease-like isoform X3 [Battus philenor]|uniref:vitellin-degrading protease-like isoform X3 n=1 Tax=Battus philenor TaxID=42288 RepID=UPI0035D13251